MLHRCTADLNKRAGQQRFRLAVSLLAQLVLCAYFQSASAQGGGVFQNESEGEQQVSGVHSTQSVTTLEFGKPVERELAGDLEHRYQISLTQGQYASVVIEQRGIDLVAQLLSIDSKPIADVDVEIRNQGQEKIELVAETSGSYHLLVKARYSKLPAGRYEVRWVEVREATENDRLLYEARRLQAESKRLSDAGKYSEALPLAERALELRERVWREDPDLHQTLLNLAAINFRKGNYGKAEELGQRALSVAESALGSDHPIVARLLYTLGLIYDTRGDDARAEPLLQRALLVQERAL